MPSVIAGNVNGKPWNPVHGNRLRRTQRQRRAVFELGIELIVGFVTRHHRAAERHNGTQVGVCSGGDQVDHIAKIGNLIAWNNAESESASFASVNLTESNHGFWRGFGRLGGNSGWLGSCRSWRHCFSFLFSSTQTTS
ncbi:MAG: hypothetical protein BWY63_03257 [Chloroflexi bacterium ADurb.Bin360]|nr:MAG: hypothetical protein BWY63_03257 [Chloroflexi bacterium ADurb.Bin360]